MPAPPNASSSVHANQATATPIRPSDALTARHRSIGFVANQPASAASSARPQPSPTRLRSGLASWPKAELHLHLDGSLLVETAIELARTRGVEAPTEIAGM